MTSTDGKAGTGYVYDGPRVIETIGADAGTFVRGDSTGLLSQTVGNNPATEVVLADLLGTVLGVARPNGISSKIATFTDFGEYVGNQHPAGTFGFTGELQGVATSRTDFLARSYDPASARFLQRDRVGQDLTEPMTWQPYLYAFAAPTTYADYLGAFGWSDIGKIAVSVAVGVAVTAVIVATAPVSVPALLVTAAAVTAGGVASGIAYRAVDGQSASQIFDPKSIAIDAGISLLTLGAGKLVAPVVRSTATRVAGTRVAQSVATSHAAKITAAQVARARTVARATQQRAADAAANARTAASNVRSSSTENIKAGLSTVRSRTTSVRSGRAAVSEPAAGSADRSAVTGLQHRAAGAPAGIEPVLFGQARVGANFSTRADVPVYLRGRSIADVTAELRAGAMSPDAIPITAFEHQGQLVSVNNRGLAALSDAGLTPTNLSVVDKGSLPPNVLARLGETPTALGTTLPWPSIAVTPSMSDWTVLRTITVPGFG